MKTQKQLIAVIVVIFLLMGTCWAGMLDQMVKTESERIIAQYKGVFTSPPERVPTTRTVDGPIIGNGDVGVVIGGPPEAQRFWISKNDFWKAKPHWPYSMPCAIGWIDVKLPQFVDASYLVEQIIYEGETQSIFKKGDVSIKIRSWVAATENLLVIELVGDGGWMGEDHFLELNVDARLTPMSGNSSEIASGPIKDGYWATRKFTGEDLDWPAEVAVVMRQLRRGEKKLPSGTLGWTSDRFNLQPSGEPVFIVASILTNYDTDDYLEKARERIESITYEEIESLREKHKAWWHDFWARSFVEIGDPLIEKFWYGSQYIMACCSRNKNFPPGLWGNWTTTDEPAWAGDYHLNYNHQAPWLGVYSSNQVELSEPYDTPILEYMPRGREFARKLLGVKGVYYNVGLGPMGLDTSNEWSTGGFYGQKSNAVYCTVNMMMRFYHTYDLEYARKVYPFLIEVADFWEDYLKFENGRYVDYDDSEGEVGTWQGEDWRKGFGKKNPRRALGLIRQFFAGIIDVSTELGVDADRHEKWRHILEYLSEPDNKGIFGGVVDFVWPSGVIGLDSDPKILQQAHKEIDAWQEGGRSFDTRNVTHVFAATARVGYDPDVILSMMQKRIRSTGFENLWIFQGGGGIETCGGFTAGLNEMLLQSHEKVLRLFPVWPKDKDAHFGRLRAVGAFLVSSGYMDGQVQYAIIESEKGRDCTVLNPWPGKAVALYRNGSKAETLKGDRFTFKTKNGENISLVPDGVSFDQMHQRIQAVQ
ncbi:glycoside hydrolase family 95-like protein [Planctomycetota bacterium]